MSSGPTLTGKTCIQSTKRQYLTLNFTRKSWCTYEGKCGKEDVICSEIDLCLLCKYRKPLDIPMNIKFQKNAKVRVNYGKSDYEGE